MFSPKALSRREVLQTAGMLGVTAGANAVATAEQNSGLYFAKESGLVTGKMKPLKYEEIPGLLTKDQVTPHYQAHYGGALKRLTTIEQQLDGLYRGKEPLGGDALTNYTTVVSGAYYWVPSIEALRQFTSLED